MRKNIPWDSEVSYSGVVGDDITEPVDNIILFAHGNSRDGADWERHFKYFQEKGVRGGRLWAISFDNSKLTHKELSNQLEDFVSRIGNYLDYDSISFVSHSLGVTVGRTWMYRFDRYDDVDKFVGIAGANNGIMSCPPKEVASELPDSHKYKPCQALAKISLSDTLIDKLNKQVDENNKDVKFYTIRGTRDSYFKGCRKSPTLDFAEENVSINTDHDGARSCKTSVQLVYNWVSN